MLQEFDSVFFVAKIVGLCCETYDFMKHPRFSMAVSSVSGLSWMFELHPYIDENLLCIREDLEVLNDKALSGVVKINRSIHIEVIDDGENFVPIAVVKNPIKAGIWLFEVQCKKLSGLTSVGVFSRLEILESCEDFCMYMSNGCCYHGGDHNISGNEPWGEEDHVGVILNMGNELEKDENERKLYFLKNGVIQPMNFVNIPKNLHLGIELVSKGNKVKVISLLQLHEIPSLPVLAPYPLGRGKCELSWVYNEE